MTLNQYRIAVKKAVHEDIKNGLARQMYDEITGKKKFFAHVTVLNELIEINKKKVWDETDIFKKLDLVSRDGFGYPPLDNKRKEQLLEIITKKLKGEM